jgi:hypothetical protein
MSDWTWASPPGNVAVIDILPTQMVQGCHGPIELTGAIDATRRNKNLQYRASATPVPALAAGAVFGRAIADRRGPHIAPAVSSTAVAA